MNRTEMEREIERLRAEVAQSEVTICQVCLIRPLLPLPVPRIDTRDLGIFYACQECYRACSKTPPGPD